MKQGKMKNEAKTLLNLTRKYWKKARTKRRAAQRKVFCKWGY